jgi:hypothetical protein
MTSIAVSRRSIISNALNFCRSVTAVLVRFSIAQGFHGNSDCLGKAFLRGTDAALRLRTHCPNID